MITFSKLGQYGRLGNQLWQIASTVGIGINSGQRIGFPEWKYREHFSNPLPRMKDKPEAVYNEGQPYYRDIKLTLDTDLEGYFQSWKYFSFCKSTIRYYLDFKRHKSDGVAVHVRRGDYLEKQNVHPVLPLGYYLDAMEYFDGEHFTVFSDDIQWCKHHLRGANVSFHASDGDINDFKIMTGFSKFIIANSSYSWWAAWLSGSKEIVAPKLWVHGEDRDDRVPPEWTRI